MPTYTYNKKEPDTQVGDINYLLDTREFNAKVLTFGIPIFLICYIATVGVSFLYLGNIMYMQYYFPKIEDETYQKKRKLLNYYRSLTIGSPFKIFKLDSYDKNINSYIPVNSGIKEMYSKTSEEVTKNSDGMEIIKGHDVFLGLSKLSYYIMAIVFTIPVFLIIDGYLNTFMFSLFSATVQVNSDYTTPPNNPYYNTACIQKISLQDPVNSSVGGYNVYSPYNPYASSTFFFGKLGMMSYVFLIPFFTNIFFFIFKFDNYDLKKNKFIGIILLFLMFYPLIITIISRVSYPLNFNMLDELQKFIVPIDYPYIDYIKNSYSDKMLYIFLFLSIIFIYIYYNFCHLIILPNKFVFFIIFMISIFVLVPLLLMFIPLSIVFSSRDYISTSSLSINNITNHIKEKEPVSNLSQLLIKYNYPCFPRNA